MADLENKVKRTIEKLEPVTVKRIEKLMASRVLINQGGGMLPLAETMTYQEFSQLLGRMQANAEMIANNLRRIQEEL